VASRQQCCVQCGFAGGHPAPGLSGRRAAAEQVPTHPQTNGRWTRAGGSGGCNVLPASSAGGRFVCTVATNDATAWGVMTCGDSSGPVVGGKEDRFAKLAGGICCLGLPIVASAGSLSSAECGFRSEGERIGALPSLMRRVWELRQARHRNAAALGLGEMCIYVY
jgi:hypothetical protein